jgi:nucleoside-diphosphate-sugar epimerase
MIARAFVKQNPFEVWGDGSQIRNWTHVDDIVEGTLLACEKIDDGAAVNLGTMERVRVSEAARLVMEYTRHRCDIRFMPHMPTGPANRVADNRLAKRLLGWEPRVPFRDGLRRTIDWYFSNRQEEDVRSNLDQILLER